MTENEYRALWKQEEAVAKIHGWDFSHIHGRYLEEHDLPWDYREKIKQLRKDEMQLLDYDTGGGEFLLSLGHPYQNTAATEGYPPNVELCRQVLLPLGVDFRPCDDPKKIPFEAGRFDLVLNRHGDFDPQELHRILKPGGIFVTEQVGDQNDRDLVKLVLPEVAQPYCGLNADTQKRAFASAEFEILEADEAFRPIEFYDVGAFVWFAHIIEWEFPGFSVDRCFEHLLKLQQKIDSEGKISGTIHRYLLIAKNKA